MARPSPPARILAAALAATALACQKPAVGPSTAPRDATPATHALGLKGAAVSQADRTVTVDLDVTLGGEPVTLAALTALRPAFTLAELTTDPESGVPAWRSHLLTGSQTAPENPIGGPGTRPENVLSGEKQPGSESSGTLAERAEGGFRYTFAYVLPEGHDPAHTYRIAAWLGGVAGTPTTNATLDFVPGGGVPAPRDLVADADCQRCHAQVLAHGRRVGVKVCVTCHTYQAVDPDTVDPAAAFAAVASPATPDTNPNPLDFGRLVHRIHRGKRLPTLYAPSSTAPAPALGTVALPLPFSPSRNAVVNGRRFGIVGHQSRVFTFGEVKTWTSPDGTTFNKAVAGGVTFPRDYRDCAVCHASAPQGDQAYTIVTRRTCAGCHPDVWFVDAAPPDAAHFAHPGGVQLTDADCRGCHLAEAGGPRLYVDNREVHTPVIDHARFSPIEARIVSVTNFLPGQKPTVVFTLADRTGVISPLNDPANPPPPDAGPAPSPVPRKVTRVSFVVSGPTWPDHLTGNAPLSESISFAADIPAADILVADGAGRFTYTFKTVAVPETATGAWTVMLEARRSLAAPTPRYDPVADTFSWPFTGEGLTEAAANAFVDVGVEVGSSATPALARRTVVSSDRCNACHKKLTFHGSTRSGVESCVLCHTPDKTDWGRRPKLGSGNVNLAGTLDGLEERSVHFKTMIHRIHTGGAAGIAAIDAEPFVLYSGPVFFDELFPGNLANCRLCHAGESFRLEAIPVGASPTIANENPTLVHLATGAHPATEARRLPMTAACTSCHDTGTARDHAARKTVGGQETCVSCHGAAAEHSVYTLHGLQPP